MSGLVRWLRGVGDRDVLLVVGVLTAALLVVAAVASLSGNDQGEPAARGAGPTGSSTTTTVGWSRPMAA